MTTADVAPRLEPGSAPGAPTIEITDSRSARVGGFEVRRALPRRGRRTVGAWCFVDHMGPASVSPERGLDIGPHPHIGLQTVTWLLEGEALHRDSLGSEQVIRPGQLNLMTAGHGIAHAEESTGRRSGTVHGVQLWVALPSTTRDGPPAFEHHPELPVVELGRSRATVLVGELGGASSPARRDTDHVGVDLDLPPAQTVLPLRPELEYGLVVAVGAIRVEGRVMEPGHLGYIGSGRSECRIETAVPTRALLIGGTPFEEPVLIWWNFVARRQEEIAAAHADWRDRSPRFGEVCSTLPRSEVGAPPWAAGPA